MSAPCPVYGFTLGIVSLTGAPIADPERLVADLIEYLEPHGLVVDVARDIEGAHIIRREGSQATDADRELTREWARRWSDVAHVRVSDLIDLSRVA
jgi:hypothetical protein